MDSYLWNKTEKVRIVIKCIHKIKFKILNHKPLLNVGLPYFKYSIIIQIIWIWTMGNYALCSRFQNIFFSWMGGKIWVFIIWRGWFQSRKILMRNNKPVFIKN